MYARWQPHLQAGGALADVKHSVFRIAEGEDERISRLERQVTREREARLAAEAIAEKGLRDLYNSQRRLALLQRITERANSADDIQAALSFALREICAEMDWDFGNAYLVPMDGSAAIACDCWHLSDPHQLAPFVEASRHIRFERGIGLPGRVLTDTRAHWVADVREDANFLRHGVAIDCRVVAGCAFPIMAGSDVVAIYEFFSRRTMIPDDGMVETITQIGIQLGRVVERVRSREALLHDALHDALTGLPNRVLLSHRAQAAFKRLPSSGNGLAVLVIDLNGFKAVNDQHGHHLGDNVLVAVTQRLSESLDKCLAIERGNLQITLARSGGDEFVVLLDGIADRSVPAQFADALHAALQTPFFLAGNEIIIGASIGIAKSGSAYTDIGQIMRDADLAMYEAKAGKRGNTVKFTPALGNRVRNRMALEQEIREAVSDEQFVLYYQPIVDLGSGRLEGYEALVRWLHPQRGLIPPDDFIPIAEETGLIVFLGEWVLREACAAMARLHLGRTTAHLPSIAVNIAPMQFLQPNFVPQLQRILIETGAPGSCLKLEVTEGVAIIDAERTRLILEQCRAIGVRTGLDDFGTGYSSLSYLHSLPFDTLKIDRSFIAALDQPKGLNIVRAILDLAKKLGLGVVAEGIETNKQSRMLEAWGCNSGQGYLLGRPQPEGQAFDLAAQLQLHNKH